MLHTLRERNPLPPGATVVGGGLAVSGVATFAFFAVTSRALDPASYAALGVLWSLLFAVGNGVMQPLEQEVARAVAARRAHGLGPGPVVRRAMVIGAAFTLALVLVGLVTHQWLLNRLLDGRTALVVAFLIGLGGFCAGHLARGTLSSHGRFRNYALFFGVDGLTRVIAAVALFALGVAAVGPYGAVLAAAPFVAVGIALAGQRGLLEPGPPASWQELSKALGWLLLGTSSLALVVNGGTIAVQLLATDGERDAAGVFLNGLQVARIPLFLFQAVLASLLPRLSRLATRGDLDAFASTLARLVGAIAACGVVATAAAFLVGPHLVELLFGSETVLGGRDLALLAATFVAIMVAISLDQALIALGGHAQMALGWLLALATFVGVTALGNDLFLRVELGLLAASVVAVVWQASWLTWRRRSHATPELVSMAEAAAEAPLPE
ncbi:MAG: hypothetical protein JJU45_14415 [Acidimicrobiia bacterium]|nr:hypothetical protein [Acidimicrobiia bacterium]